MLNKTLWAIAISVSAGIASIGGAVAVIDASPYRPAWLSEHLELAGRSDRLALEIRQSELYDIARTIHAYQADNKPVPAHLITRRNWLQRKVKELEKALGLD